MAVSGTYRYYLSARTYIPIEYHPTRSDLLSALDVWELEAKARRMFAWKEPKKRITVSTVPVIRRYDKIFTGRNFPVGGPKK